MNESAKAYVRGYNDGIKDAINLITACSDCLDTMLNTAKDKFKAMGINIDEVLSENN